MLQNRDQFNPLLIIIDFRKKYGTDFFLEMESRLYAKILQNPNNLKPIVIYFWETRKNAIVLGMGQKAENEVNLKTAQNLGIPVFCRRSGGGAVFHGKGNLCFTIIFPNDLQPGSHNIIKSFELIGKVIIETLSSFKVPAIFMPPSDIAVFQDDSIKTEHAKKVSGNAQWRRKNYILHHGTFLLDMDLDLIEKLLKEPSKRPKYRQFRNHLSFVSNLSTLGISKVPFTIKLLEKFFIFFKAEIQLKKKQEILLFNDDSQVSSKIKNQQYFSTWLPSPIKNFPSPLEMEKDILNDDISSWKVY